MELHSVTTLWPFHTWAFDLIGPINPLAKGHIWVLIATECFTKSVEAVSLKKATRECGLQVWDSRRIIYDNDTPF
ncbi:hypothetical protein CCACVL1_29922, partial [Corchorus capsularis]